MDKNLENQVLIMQDSQDKPNFWDYWDEVWYKEMIFWYEQDQENHH